MSNIYPNLVIYEHKYIYEHILLVGFIMVSNFVYFQLTAVMKQPVLEGAVEKTAVFCKHLHLP